MAEIDRAAFAEAVACALARRGLSFGQAVARWPDLNKALLSRAAIGKPLSAGNYLRLCQALRLSPWRFLVVVKQRRVTLRSIVKTFGKQPVTAPVSREAMSKKETV